MSDAPSDHLLRTLAAVPVTSRILIVGEENGRHASPLGRLGFEVGIADADFRTRGGLTAPARVAAGNGLPSNSPTSSVHLSDLSNDTFDWVIAYDAFPPAETSVEDVLDALVTIRRVLVSGGWLYAAIHTGNIEQSESELILAQYQLMERAGFELAEKADVIRDRKRELVRGIFRRVDADTPP